MNIRIGSRIVFVMVVTLLLVLSFTATLAHSVSFAWGFGGTCDSISLYLGTYHGLSGPVGGVSLNGTRYDFTTWVEDLPVSNIDGSTFDAGYDEASVRWLTVTVSGLPEGVYTVNPSSDSSTETPSGGWPKTVTISCPPSKKGVTPGSDLFLPGDDRINHSASDRAAPVAVYCKADYDRVLIWKVDFATGHGYNEPTINVSYAEIDAKGIPTKRNLLLAENDGVQLWRLTTGELQVNTFYPTEPGKSWIYVWDDCPVTESYHLAR